MPTTLKRAPVGLGLAGALFLGAGAAVAQTTGGEVLVRHVQGGHHDHPGLRAGPLRHRLPRAERQRQRHLRPEHRIAGDAGTDGGAAPGPPRGQLRSPAGRRGGQSQPRRLKNRAGWR